MNISEPRQGIHSYRIFDVAIVDVALTVLFTFMITKKNRMLVFIILILLSIIIHTMLGIKTKTNTWLLE
jgi:hypothetical protein